MVEKGVHEERQFLEKTRELFARLSQVLDTFLADWTFSKHKFLVVNRDPCVRLLYRKFACATHSLPFTDEIGKALDVVCTVFCRVRTV